MFKSCRLESEWGDEVTRGGLSFLTEHRRLDKPLSVRTADEISRTKKVQAH